MNVTNCHVKGICDKVDNEALLCHQSRDTLLCHQSRDGRGVIIIPDSKVHGANMGPIWGRQDPGGPHVGPVNFAIWDINNVIPDT